MTRAAAKSSASKSSPAFTWPFLGRVLLKALLLFVAFNLLFAVLYPMGALGRISFYNLLFPGRERFPFGENSQQSYNLNLYNLDAMFASLALNAAPALGAPARSAPSAGAAPEGEYRVLVVGDSSVWGTLAAPRGYPGWED